uniref:Uncharacterized protein n=1 Tax=Salmo trutta TaxID=8032 RepID=A0A674EX30_SALTR
MKNQGVPFNKDTFTLATGTCYKLVRTCPPCRYCIGPPYRQQVGHLFFSLSLSLSLSLCRICQNLKVSSNIHCLYNNFVTVSTLGFSSPAFIKKPEFAQEVASKKNSKWIEDSPLTASVEQAVSRLQQAGQVTQRNLDEMLCHTPIGKKRMPMGIMDERRISRRTLRPLQSTLLSE